MTYLFIGAGPSNIISSYLIKKREPESKVIILEGSNKPLKRILVSGNGRCNFFNKNLLDFKKLENKVNNYLKFLEFFKNVNADDFLTLLKEDFNFNYFHDEEGRMYPFSNLATSLFQVLLTKNKEIGVEIILDSLVKKIDSSKKVVFTKDKTYSYDKLIIATGGLAYDRLSLNVLPLLNDLNLKYESFTSGLAPLIVKEKIFNFIVGSRLKGNLTLYKNEKIIHQEEGELLFKKDGLSGICIFNCSFFFKEGENFKIVFNPLIHSNVNLTFDGSKNFEELEGTFNENILKFLKVVINKNRFTYNDILKAFTFTPFKKYPLKDAQISLGGVLLNQLNDDFSLKSNKDIYLAGELINLHAVCGGYNLGLAFLSGFKLGNSL